VVTPTVAFDALENLPKEAQRQVAFGELPDEVPGMSDEPHAGLEEPQLEAGERPALDGDGHDQPARQIGIGGARRITVVPAPRSVIAVATRAVVTR
jgi:hypothetical protein